MAPSGFRVHLLLAFCLIAAASAVAGVSGASSTARAEGPIGGGGGIPVYSAYAARNSSVGYDTKYTDLRVINPVGTADTGTLVVSNPGGTVAYSQTGIAFPALGGRSFNQLYQPLPDGFRGSVTLGALTGGAPMLSIVNIAGAHSMMGYTSQATGANTVYLPAVFRNYWGWTTNFSIRNLGGLPVDLHIAYRRADGTSPFALDWPNLAVDGSLQFDQASMSALGSSFNGSVTITADQPIVVEVNEESPTASDFAAYTGVPSSDLAGNISLPSVLKNAWGWTTDIRVMNTSSSPAAIVIPFYDSNGALSTSISDTLPAYSSRGYNQGSMGALPNGWAGSASVLGPGPVLAVVVNEVHTSGAFLAYEGVPLGHQTATAFAPSVLKNIWGWTSDLRIRNLGGTNTAVQVDFYNMNGTLRTGTSQLVGPGKVWSCNQAFLPGLGTSWEGWARITSSPNNISVVVNEMHDSGKGVAYTAINQ